jgi:hypothetical protein
MGKLRGSIRVLAAAAWWGRVARGALLASIVALSTACPSPITIAFKVTWQTKDGSELPIANMNVIVQSQDGEQTFTLRTTDTGQGAVTFNDNPGIVTVIVEPTNLQVAFYPVCPPNKVSVYVARVGPFAQPPIGVVNVSLGRHPAAGAWAALNSSAARLAAAGLVMPKTNVCFSQTGEGNAWLPGAGYLRLNESDSSFVDIVNHEYGHAVMQAAAGQKVTTQNCNPHGMKRPLPSASCAWVEGWADFFAIFARYSLNDPNPIIFGGDSMEAYSSPVTGKDGYADEGRVAAALWDLIDTHDDASDDPQYGQKGYRDANATTPFRMSWMLQSMRGADVDSFTGTIRVYFDRLLQNPHVTRQAAAAGRSIMSYNWVARPAPPVAEAPRIRRAVSRSR